MKLNVRRRRLHEKQATLSRTACAENQPEFWPELHEEIDRLPDKYREPVILCYLEGLSVETAALRLGCPHGTILSRLSRARDRLRGRLTRRGLVLERDLKVNGFSSRGSQIDPPLGPARRDSSGISKIRGATTNCGGSLINDRRFTC